MIKKTEQLVTNIWKLLQLAWREDRKLLVAYFTTSALGAILLFVVYYFYKLMIDAVAESIGLNLSDPVDILFTIIVTYLFFEYLSRFVNFTFNQYFLDYFMRTKLQNILTRRFMEKIGRLDFANLENGEVRNLIAKIENTYAFRLPEILNRLNAMISNVASIFFSLIIALQFSPYYFILLALISAPVYYLRAKYANISFSSASEHAHDSNYLWYLKSIFTNFNTLSEMKIYELRGYFVHKAKELQDQIIKDYQRPMLTYSILSTASFVLIPVAIYFSLTHFLQGIGNTYSIGDFTFFLNILFAFSGQISSLLINFGSVYENGFYLNDFFKLMSIRNKIEIDDNAFIFESEEPRRIEFTEVSFQYPGSNHYSLKNISFTIEKGQNVAIVGHNGAGKSTIIKLLFRFYDPTEGAILIDGKDLRSIDLESWYRHLGVLFQDYARYFLTLRENIMFGKHTVSSEKRAEEALEKAQALGILEDLPKGYDQYLGRWFEGGVDMSGGQWQKVAIARAIYRNAPLLIMDEPTANIDADAEAEIFKNLNELYRRKSLIFISHRFSTVRTANDIFVMKRGELVERGTHEQLIAIPNGTYASYFNLQRKGYM